MGKASLHTSPPETMATPVAGNDAFSASKAHHLSLEHLLMNSAMVVSNAALLIAGPKMCPYS